MNVIENETKIEYKLNFEMKFPNEGEYVIPYLNIGKVIE